MKHDGCTGKVRYKSKDGACIAAKRINNVALNVYHCPKCHGWHLGNSRSPFRFQQRIDQILNRYPEPTA